MKTVLTIMQYLSNFSTPNHPCTLLKQKKIMVAPAIEAPAATTPVVWKKSLVASKEMRTIGMIKKNRILRMITRNIPERRHLKLHINLNISINI